MHLTKEQTYQIQDDLKKVDDIQELLQLLNTVNLFVYGDKYKKIQLKSFTYYANPKLSGERYRMFRIAKKSGGKRTIHAPKNTLKYIQTTLNIFLQAIYTPHPNATGFVPEKSIADNARKHTGMNYVLNIDLKDFFHSVELHRVKAVLKLPPFNFPDTKDNPIAFMLANIVCNEFNVERRNEQSDFIKTRRSVLPQGAPTSPTVSNMVAKRLDRKLTGLSKRFGLNYTRYADDITFSSQHNVYSKQGPFFKELIRIIESQNFYINPAKTRLQKRDYRQEVTGLTVNDKINTPRHYVKQLRMWLYYWETYGYVRASEIFANDYYKDKGHIKEHIPNLENVLAGKLDYLKMIKGENNSTHYKLNKRFRKLINKHLDEKLMEAELETVISEWENKGMEAAIVLFNKIRQQNG